MKYIGLEDLKTLIGVSDEDHDTYLQMLEEAAEGIFEKKINRSLMYDPDTDDGAITEYFDGGFRLRLRKFPVREIVTFNNYSSAIDPEYYSVDNKTGNLVFNNLNYPIRYRRLTLTYKGGYDAWDADDQDYPVPQDIKLCIAEIVKTLYDPDGDSLGNSNVKSFRIGDYSETMGDSTTMENNSVISSVINNYLYYEL
jgi:hypothetical protein